MEVVDKGRAFETGRMEGIKGQSWQKQGEKAHIGCCGWYPFGSLGIKIRRGVGRLVLRTLNVLQRSS